MPPRRFYYSRNGAKVRIFTDSHHALTNPPFFIMTMTKAKMSNIQTMAAQLMPNADVEKTIEAIGTAWRRRSKGDTERNGNSKLGKFDRSREDMTNDEWDFAFALNGNCAIGPNTWQCASTAPAGGANRGFEGSTRQLTMRLDVDALNTAE